MIIGYHFLYSNIFFQPFDLEKYMDDYKFG